MLIISLRPEAIILSLFWVVFHGLLPQMRSNFYRGFNSNEMQASASHMLRLLRQSEKFLDIKQNKFFFLTYSKTLFVYTVLRPMSYAPFLCRINVSWRYTIVASFICIAFVVLKLKIFKDFCTELASMKWLFFIGGGEGGLCPLTLSNIVRVRWYF